MKDKAPLIVIVPCCGWGAYRVWWCFQHPEVWDSQPANDPRICLPIFGLFCGIIAVKWHRLNIRHKAYMERRSEYTSRINAAIEAVKENRRQGRTEEADAAYYEALRLTFEKQEWLNSLKS